MNKYLLLFSLAAYLFIAVSYIFYLPPLSSFDARVPVSTNSTVKRQNQQVFLKDMYYMQRTDKSTIDERKKMLSDISVFVGAVFILLFSYLFLRPFRLRFNPRNFSVANGQYTYLALCTFRI